MASTTSLHSEDLFQCSICLEVFTDPVTAPCGHSFCRACIQTHWDATVPGLAADPVPAPVLAADTIFTVRRLMYLLFLVCVMMVCVVYLPHPAPETDERGTCSRTDPQGACRTPNKPLGGLGKMMLQRMKAEMQQMIKERLEKLQEVKASAELSKRESDRDGEAIMGSIVHLKLVFERGQRALLEIEEKQKAAVRTTEGLIKDLDQEISELQRRSTELEHLSPSEDHLLLLQSESLPSQDWSEISFHSVLSVRSLRGVVFLLWEELQSQIKEIGHVELREIQIYKVDVSLDPDTASRYLILSGDGKQVRHGDTRRNVPDNPERFDTSVCVLGKEGFSSGRFYYEVQVKDKTAWILGVARESINRKGQNKQRPNQGFWTIWLRDGTDYHALAGPSLPLSLSQEPQKVGVFVDYEEGEVSFYDVDHSSHIYSFTGQTFTEKLYPFFSPLINDRGKNSAPLVVTPVVLID